MPASVARPVPSAARQQIVDSLMFTAPPSLNHLADLLSDASSKAGWASWEIRPGPSGVCHEPSEEAIQDAFESVFKAYLGLYATIHAKGTEQ